MKRRILVLAMSLVSVLAFCGSAQASCSSTSTGHAANPLPPLKDGVFLESTGWLQCGPTDYGEVYLFFDWYQPSTGTWYAVNGPGMYLDYVGKLDAVNIGYSLDVDCSLMSRQLFRARLVWNNWTTGIFGNQAMSSASGPLC